MCICVLSSSSCQFIFNLNVYDAHNLDATHHIKNAKGVVVVNASWFVRVWREVLRKSFRKVAFNKIDLMRSPLVCCRAVRCKAQNDVMENAVVVSQAGLHA
jgi:hypothetical protein